MDWKSSLSAFVRRVRLLRSWKYAAFGGTAGSALAVVLAILDWTRVRYTEPWVLAVLVLAGIGLGALIGFFRKVDPRQLADSIDRRASLGDRLSTALEGQQVEMHDAQEADAFAHLKEVRPKEAFPARVTRWHAAPVVLSLVAALFFALGNTPFLMSQQGQEDRKDVMQKGEELIEVAKPILEKPDASVDEDAKKLANKIEDLGRDMQKGRMTKEEALKKHNELAQEARKLAQQKNEESKTAMEQSQQAMKQMAMKEVAKEMGLSEEEAKALENEDLSKMSSEELSQQESDAMRQLEDLKQQIASGKDAEGKPLSKEQLESMQKMQKELQELLKQLQFSQKVKDFLKRMYDMPEFKDLMEAMRKLQETQKKSDEGKLDQPELTKKELEELKEQLKQKFEAMQKKLEEMAKTMSDEDIKKMIQEMIEALKKGCGT